MSRTQNNRWKRKAVVVAAVAASFAGYAALGSGTVSAGNYSEWDCSDMSSSALNSDQCTIPTDYTEDTTPDETYPQDTVPEETIPDTTDPVDTLPETTVPVTTQPAPQQFPPAPTTAAPVAPAVVPAVAAEVVQAPPALPVTGRGSVLPTAFIAVGLLGAGSVALAFARRNSAARTTQS